MRKLTDAEIQQINGAGSTTYKLANGVSITTTLMPNQSTTITAVVGNRSFSANSGEQLSKMIIGAGVGGMVLPFTGPLGALVVGQMASFGAGALMDSVNLGG